MTTRVPSYTVAELVEETGFDRRTIAYYVQEGLLPKVGRRGPRTRYPRLVRDRLLFIRSVREAEEAGSVGAVSLSELRGIFERLGPALIARVADGRLAVTQELLSPSTAFRLPARRRAVLRERVEGWAVAHEQRPRFGGDAEAPPAESRLNELLSLLQKAAERGGDESPRTMETWTRIDISSEIALSVRNLSEEDRKLVEAVRSALREVVLPGGSRSTTSRATSRKRENP